MFNFQCEYLSPFSPKGMFIYSPGLGRRSFAGYTPGNLCVRRPSLKGIFNRKPCVLRLYIPFRENFISTASSQGRQFFQTSQPWALIKYHLWWKRLDFFAHQTFHSRKYRQSPIPFLFLCHWILDIVFFFFRKKRQKNVRLAILRSLLASSTENCYFRI